MFASLLFGLQLPGLEPCVYFGSPKPAGDLSSSTYVEARRDLLVARALLLVLAADNAGQVSDDWTFEFLPHLVGNATPVFVYLIPTSPAFPGTRWVLESTLQYAGVNIRLVADPADLLALVLADVRALMASGRN